MSRERIALEAALFRGLMANTANCRVHDGPGHSGSPSTRGGRLAPLSATYGHA